MNKQFDLKIKINRARYNVMFIILMSLINLFFIMQNGTILLPYSSAISNYSVVFGISTANETGNDAFQTFGLIISLAVLAGFFVCYYLSKKKPQFLFIAASLMVADLLVLIIVSAFFDNISSLFVILDIIIHILTLFYCWQGIRAFSELLSLKNQRHTQTEPNQNNSEDTSSDDLTKPIRKYESNGQKPIISGEINGLKVFGVIEDSIAQLIINGYVCDELEIDDLCEYELCAVINEAEIRFNYKKSVDGETAELFADGVSFAEKSL